MVRRMIASPVIVLAAVALAFPLMVDAQDMPRTTWGDPDLNGVWDFRTLTPFERPEELAEQEFFTQEEAAAFEANRLAELAARDDQEPADIVGNYNQFWLIDRWFDNRTSLIVDPPSGRLPTLTEEAESRRAQNRAARTDVTMPSFDAELARLGSGLRCRGGRVPMTGRGYNSNYQIFQTADYLAIQMEMMHDTRLIPIAGQTPHPATPRGDLGQSGGYWDGDTLVVETDGLNRGSSGSTADLRLTERFTRVGPETLEYEYTMSDPSTWTRPWTARLYMRPAPGTGVIYEFACHEGNYGMTNLLNGARVQEQAVNVSGATESK